ncbi:sigma-70 family RNA polymerase sigma factor [Nitrospirillum viridazoti]|nr:sigma-70 family RNA polymerase sigma factor [Nitrospirillum amazonense]TWB34760.1 RNA polymerase sigma-70 factor (ECF subfamily) [Nitrospirillum amazonense]
MGKTIMMLASPGIRAMPANDMPPDVLEDAAATFEPLRPRLTRLAYRMLGSVADAEDVAQEAFLRWVMTDRAGVRDAAGFLLRVVTRLCLDQLKSARHSRESYIGPWLPDPVVQAPDDLGEDAADALTLPLMLALERLSPPERAAFLLHDVFGLPFAEVAPAIGREVATCRQLASRARVHIQAARPRFPVAREEGMRLAAAFFTASREGDLARLRTLLAEDVAAYADGGGRVRATLEPVLGIDAAMKLLAGLARLFTRTPSRLLRYALISGLPGFVTVEQGGTLQTTALDIRDGRIRAVYVTRNPDKLRHLATSP